MGKKRVGKDRMYLSSKEWKEEWGGYKGKDNAPFKRLPFNCCAIGFTPFQDAVCTDDGVVYEITNIVPYVMKFKKHPATGAPLTLRELVQLTWHKNSDGEYHCPVMNKVFTEHTHIVAVRTAGNKGNVYCWEAVEELNIKPKNWKDLITDEPFVRKDIIHIQDPLNLAPRAIDNFDHVQRQLAVSDDEEEEGKAGGDSIRNMSDDMKRALGALKSDESKAAFEAGGGGKRAEALRTLAEAKANKQEAATGTSGRGAAASTSGLMPPPSATPAAAAAAHNKGNSGAAVEGDWRLKGPERDNTALPAFKPGTMTWDTEDYMADAKEAHKKKGASGQGAGKAGDGGGQNGGDGDADRRAGGGGASTSGRMNPMATYEAAGHVKYIESATTTGAMSRSFTSTAIAVTTKNQRTLVRLERNPAKKGYLRLHTNLGDINVELHCDIVPRTCENFIALCEMGYFNGTIFHRSIKNFMIQGGDPTATGKGGESIYGPTFKDEIDSRLVHAGRGVLSMANSGKNTNGSQFFITYKSCRHLDWKHSVFGQVVGGLDVLTAMERVPVDVEDRPKQEIKITGASVFCNPFQELEEEERRLEEKERRRKEQEAAAASDATVHKVGSWYSNPSAATAAAPAAQRSTGVGKYISTQRLSLAPQVEAPPQAPSPSSGSTAGAGAGTAGVGPAAGAAGSQGARSASAAAAAAEPAAKKPKVGGSFGDFSSW